MQKHIFTTLILLCCLHLTSTAQQEYSPNDAKQKMKEIRSFLSTSSCIGDPMSVPENWKDSECPVDLTDQHRVPVQLHVTINDFTRSPSVSQDTFLRVLDRLNDAFSDGNFFFYAAGPISIVSDTSLNVIRSEDIFQKMEIFRDSSPPLPGVINCYIPQIIESISGSYPFFATEDHSVVTMSSFNFTSLDIQTVAHEFGHALGLLHTFASSTEVGQDHMTCAGLPANADPSRFELVIRTEDSSLPYPYPNCEFACPPDSPYGVEQRAGDLLCDTPADPYRGDDTPCMASPDGCTYTGMLANGDTIRDLNGQLYQPDESNYMSYYNCRSSFTPGQYDRMLYFFLNGHFNGADCVENITEEVLRMPAGDPVRNVDALIQHFKETDCSDDGDCELDFVTPADGTFLYNCSVQGAVKARLVKEDAWLNGVSIRDVYLLSRHILEIEPLDDWNLLAADVNNSGSVTAYDMVLIRQLVLFVIQELPIGNGDNGNDATPWRFVPEKIAADHPSHFDNEPYVNNPFNVKDDNGNVLYPNYLSSNYCYEPAREKMGFRAVKAGDVNGSATAQNAMGTTTSSSRKANLLFANPRSLAAGEEFTVSLTAKQFEKVAGYGFGLSLHTDQVELMQIREGSLADFDLNNFGSTQLDQGELRVIWMDKEFKGKSLSEDESLFQLQLKAKVDVDNWQSTISIHPSSIAFDFFDHDLNEVDVQLVAKIEDVSQTTANIYEVLAFPNPAHQNFSFQLESPQDGEVQVQLYDVNGRLLLQHQQGCKLGKNQFSVPFFSSLPSGTYFYQVSNSQFSHRGRVVKME